MKYFIITKNEIEGIHSWNDAKAPVEYLKYPHRHVFFIKCKFKVTHSDRDIEIIKQQDKIENYFMDTYGKPALFRGKSCEMIAEEIVNYFEKCVSCEVLEDGFGGAEVSR